MILAALLGGLSGVSLKKIIRRIQGTVMMIASQSKSSCTCSIVPVSSLMRKPGTAAPSVIDNRLKRMPVNATIFTREDLNQLMASLLGVLRMKMLPIAARPDPKRQKTELPSQSRSRSQTPLITNTPPTTKLNRMPQRLISQLQGKAKMGCAMVNSSALSVISTELILKRRSTVTLIVEKVCTGMEFTSAAARQVSRTTKRYRYCGYSLLYNIQYYKVRASKIYQKTQGMGARKCQLRNDSSAELCFWGIF